MPCPSSLYVSSSIGVGHFFLAIRNQFKAQAKRKSHLLERIEARNLLGALQTGNSRLLESLLVHRYYRKLGRF
ncbi:MULTISPECIES: hypothetical protein [unclassified Paenibacillus]|uniref:hypothetical protein n=1 Tax=unclassified Paenibacillus TaxID=185978 RepID=UPI00356A074E